MSNIDLPRELDAYFAFAELPSTHEGRRFTITFTYMESGRLDRLQWWWQVSAAQQRAGESFVSAQREEAIGRFRKHVERWLLNGGRRLTGGDPFPQLEPVASEPVASESPYSGTELAYTRMTAGR
jgi:hypothetical protein